MHRSFAAGAPSTEAEGVLMDESEVWELLDELSDLIDQGKPSFGNSSRRSIDADQALSIIDAIRNILPDELQEARRIVHTRDDIVASAEQEADRIIDDAEQQAVTIASEQEVVRLAQQEADRIVAEAHDKEVDMRYGSFQYADETFAQLENNLNKLLDNVARCRDSLNRNNPA
jgi:cell division septum initiation protein DivIVA